MPDDAQPAAIQDNHSSGGPPTVHFVCGECQKRIGPPSGELSSRYCSPRCFEASLRRFKSSSERAFRWHRRRVVAMKAEQELKTLQKGTDLDYVRLARRLRDAQRMDAAHTDWTMQAARLRHLSSQLRSHAVAIFNEAILKAGQWSPREAHLRAGKSRQFAGTLTAGLDTRAWACEQIARFVPAPEKRRGRRWAWGPFFASEILRIRRSAHSAFTEANEKRRDGGGHRFVTRDTLLFLAHLCAWVDSPVAPESSRQGTRLAAAVRQRLNRVERLSPPRRPLQPDFLRELITTALGRRYTLRSRPKRRKSTRQPQRSRKSPIRK